jgi:hypothetical protein
MFEPHQPRIGATLQWFHRTADLGVPEGMEFPAMIRRRSVGSCSAALTVMARRFLARDYWSADTVLFLTEQVLAL